MKCARTLMILGSMSSAGKSLLATGLCRLYARRGWKVAPFKAQNMSNNAAVCAGGEIGRAQAVQAFAAGIEPSVDMNPVLLKPEADARSQVILRGRVWQTLSAKDFYERKDRLWKEITASLDRLRREYDLVIMEGSGSPVELNLYDHDLVNMAAARYGQAPCLLVGDIDRGGVFAQLLGTLALLKEDDRKYIRALVVNKFRGDLDLFSDGVRILEELGDIPVLGIVPFIKNHGIQEEDAADLEDKLPSSNNLFDIAIIHLPHISNFDDFDPLRYESGVQLRFVSQIRKLGQPSAIILPGSKNTMGDLDWLKRTGFAPAIKQLADSGVAVVGICGGFQMLGSQIEDDHHLESGDSNMPGLDLLPVKTSMCPGKIVMRSQARILSGDGFFGTIAGVVVEGYEIHIGRSKTMRPLFEIINRENEIVSVPDGASSADGRVWGCHLHGLFENDRFRHAWLRSMGVEPEKVPFKNQRQHAYDHLANELASVLDIDYLDRIIAEGV